MPRNTFNGTPVYVAINTPKIRYAFKSKMEDSTN